MIHKLFQKFCDGKGLNDGSLVSTEEKFLLGIRIKLKNVAKQSGANKVQPRCFHNAISKIVCIQFQKLNDECSFQNRKPSEKGK